MSHRAKVLACMKVGPWLPPHPQILGLLMRLGLRCLRYCVEAHDLMEEPVQRRGEPFRYQHES